MVFASFDIQVGATGIRSISQELIVFHEYAARLLSGSHDLVRLGARSSIPVSHQEAVHQTRTLSERLQAEIESMLAHNKLTSPPSTLDLILIDFTACPFFMLRDPLLIALATGVAEVCKTKVCQQFYILLPKFPGKDGAFRRKLAHFSEIVTTVEFSVTLVDLEGRAEEYATTGPVSYALGSEYATELTKAHGDRAARLEKKCVRRLGHFPSPHANLLGHTKCRHFSYYLHDCGYELGYLLRQWWASTKCQATAIAYDLRSSELLREVVVAHATRIDIQVERIVDVLSNPELTTRFRSAGPILLVLDVVDSGKTLSSYIGQLRALDVDIYPHALAGISKRGRDSTLAGHDLRIHGLITRPTEPLIETCPQCALQLPFTSEADEDIMRIRSYDILFMISRVGWAREPLLEVPGDIGERYNVLPNFSEMLTKFGDWIAYKLYNGLRDYGLPDDWFVIHPEEGDSSALSEKLYACASDELTIVRVPRVLIKKAQKAGNQWAQIINDGENDYWLNQLTSMGSGSALILDIFNGSDSTCQSLLALLRHFNLSPIAYACLVDFNPNRETAKIDDVLKFALYEWHNPRGILSTGGIGE